MSIRTIRILQIIVLALPYILIAVLWNKIPDPVPANWTNGELLPKMWHVFDNMLIPSTLLLLMVASIFFYRKKSTGYIYLMNIFVAILLIFFTSMDIIRLFKMCKIINPAVDYDWLPFAIYFLLGGNFMTKMRADYFGGIKFPWTVSNEQVWSKTHRLTGYLWVTGGIVMIVCFFIPVINEIGWIEKLLALLMLSIPIGYSYYLHKTLEPQI